MIFEMYKMLLEKNSHWIKKNLLGEIGKHDRLKICSYLQVIGSSPIVGN